MALSSSTKTNDQLDELCAEAAAAAMLEVLKPWVKDNPSLLLRNIKMPHLNKLATAAISGFVKKRSELRALTDELNDQIDDLWLA